jgi:hypothetical protein
MSDADEMKDADEKSDDDGERLATATRETRFSSRALRRTVVYRDDRRKTYHWYDDVFK